MKPMLAATIKKIEQLTFPLYASPKLDGIRALTYRGQLVSRNLKPIPNKHVQETLSWLPESLDGELIVGKPEAPDCFRVTSSGIMSEDGQPAFKFYIFDKWDVSYTFEERQQLLKQFFKSQKVKSPYLYHVPQVKVTDAFMVHEYEQTMLEKGFEGVMLRAPKAGYKFGRSTMSEQGLMKLKQFADSEAKIIGFEERMHNANEKTTDELGRSKRSSHKANKHGTGTLGALRVVDCYSGVEFDVGTGFDDALRAEIWNNRKVHLDKVIKYKYFPLGSKDKPRFPVFHGFREAADLS